MYKTTEDAENTDFIKSIRALCALCSLKTTYYANYTKALFVKLV